MSDGEDHTGLGGMRIPLFIGGAFFFFYEAFRFHRIAIGAPKEVLANNNATLITQRLGGLIPNANLPLEIMFGLMMLIAGIVSCIGLTFGTLHYLGFPRNKKPEVSKEQSK